MREIPLTRGLVALVDDEDAEWLGQWKWHAGSPTDGACYAKRRCPLLKQPIFMHRVIMAPPPGMLIDHIDGDGLNNQRANLRLATSGENARNQRRRKPNVAGYKGVYAHGRGYRATIRVDGKVHRLGVYISAESAYVAYCAAARRLHGEFASFE